MKRFVILLALLGAALGLAAVASAGPPTITHERQIHSVYTLTPADTGCEFDVLVDGYDDVVIQNFFDKDGTLVKTVFHDRFVGTETANGVTLATSEHATITEDFRDGTETWTGQPFKLSLTDGGTLMLDAGKLVYDASGAILVQHGPHQYLDDQAAYCAAFQS